MVEHASHGSLVVGVQPRQPDSVVEVAATLAHTIGAGLVCVMVDPSLISVGRRSDGSEITEPIDPDVWSAGPEHMPDELAARIRSIAERHGVPVELSARVDDPARTLAAVADECDAAMIVVGTRTGRSRRVAEFFNGSVAARLAHQQHRPVLVVPVDPVGFDNPLPWTSA